MTINNLTLAALITDHPSPELQSNADLYSPLIGSWKVTTLDYTTDGRKVTTTGEWHFSWVLDGRAIQDVLISPERAQREVGMSKLYNRYGTTIRIYNDKTQQWNITWFNPVNGSRNSLVAKADGKRIVQEGKEEDGTLLRWIFNDIQQDSFHWSGESSNDNGTTWTLHTEFLGERR